MADLIEREMAIKYLTNFKEAIDEALHEDNVTHAIDRCIFIIEKAVPAADKPCPLYGGNDDKCSICGV